MVTMVLCKSGPNGEDRARIKRSRSATLIITTLKIMERKMSSTNMTMAAVTVAKTSMTLMTLLTASTYEIIIIKGTGTRDLILLKVVSLERS